MPDLHDDVAAMLGLSGQPCLSEEQIDEYLSLMEMGAPPLLACQRLGIKYDLVESTRASHDTFADRLDQVRRLLADNVAAAMYKKAMGGSAYAQLHYLRQCRPKPGEGEKAYNEIPDAVLDQLCADLNELHDWKAARDEALEEDMRGEVNGGSPEGNEAVDAAVVVPPPENKRVMTREQSLPFAE